ncbi:Soluble epoxide hydrolase [Pseudocercospora fuligena]|uniref:Soluble epoxide hydrolase n=1 Tax=Pseudocercospora fuligena TaxID=685502 RepID=A0A8H6VI91_9PEZI|nr:Soluble epoxide hydrolase [Pseudocercospora fuligena]
MESNTAMPGGKFNSLSMVTPVDQHGSAQSPPENESAANDSSKVPDDQVPKRASFMGIPPEMRLRIYDFLLDGDRITDMPVTFGRKHSCETNTYNGPRQDNLKCTCAKTVFPQILAVNKLVFAEAAPLLYATTELRLALPTYANPYIVEETLNVISGGAKASFTKAVLPTSLNELDIVIYEGDRRSNSMTSLWTRLAADCHRLKDIRLQITFDADVIESLDSVGWDQLTGVVNLPAIESLDVEILCYTGDYFPGVTPEIFAAGLDASLRAEITRLGKSIKILSFGPILAETYTVIAPDNRGCGDSSLSISENYTAPAAASDHLAILNFLNISKAHVVSHDKGGGIATSLAFEHPERVDKLVIIEYALPGGGFYTTCATSDQLYRDWQLAFFAVPDAASYFIQGREKEMLTWYFYHGSYSGNSVFSQELLETYTRAIAKPGFLRAGLKYFGAAFWEEKEYWPKLKEKKLEMPVLALGGEASFGFAMGEAWRDYVENLEVDVIPKSGHWMGEENPVWTAKRILRFLGNGSTLADVIMGQLDDMITIFGNFEGAALTPGTNASV